MGDEMVDRNSGTATLRYRPLVALIHWVSAALILVQVWLGFTFGDYPRGSPEQMYFFKWHQSVGVWILLLAIARLGVRLMSPPPPYPVTMAPWERALSVWTHRLFYVALIGLPLTGLMAISKGGPMTELVGGMKFPTIPLPALGELHEPLAFGMIGLLVLHVAGALKHQFIDRDESAGRMPPLPQPKN